MPQLIEIITKSVAGIINPRNVPQGSGDGDSPFRGIPSTSNPPTHGEKIQARYEIEKYVFGKYDPISYPLHCPNPAGRPPRRRALWGTAR